MLNQEVFYLRRCGYFLHSTSPSASSFSKFVGAFSEGPAETMPHLVEPDRLELHLAAQDDHLTLALDGKTENNAIEMRARR